MQLYVFKAKRNIYGFTKQEKGENLPEKLGPWIFFKKLDVKIGENYIAFDATEALNAIEQKGFYIREVEIKITFTESVEDFTPKS